MNVLLKPELEKFIAEHESYLRQEIQRGLAQLDNGQIREFDAEKIIAEERSQIGGEKGTR